MKYTVSEAQYKEWLKIPNKSFSELMNTNITQGQDAGLLYLYTVASRIAHYLKVESYPDYYISPKDFQEITNKFNQDEINKALTYNNMARFIFSILESTLQDYIVVSDSIEICLLMLKHKSINTNFMYHYSRLNIIGNLYNNNKLLESFLKAFKLDFMIEACSLDLSTIEKDVKKINTLIDKNDNISMDPNDYIDLKALKPKKLPSGANFKNIARMSYQELNEQLNNYIYSYHRAFEKTVLAGAATIRG